MGAHALVHWYSSYSGVIALSLCRCERQSVLAWHMPLAETQFADTPLALGAGKRQHE